MSATCHVMLMTARQPGAVAILQLWGPDAIRVIRGLIKDADFELEQGRLRWVQFDDMDEGLIARLDGQTFQLMPHGGLRVVQRLVDRLAELGASRHRADAALSMYPEAASAFEADLLMALARSKSPAVIEALTRQTELWRHLFNPASQNVSVSSPRQAILENTQAMDRLIIAPTIVVAGQPNVGKSTLLNALAGRSAAIVADLPGTTRDWVGSQVELLGQVAVHWLDTPGIRESNDPIEQRAINMARPVIDTADVLILMRDDITDFPDMTASKRQPDLYVRNKCDRSEAKPTSSDTIAISAATGEGLDTLQHAILDKLGLDTVVSGSDIKPWAFSPTLKAWCQNNDVHLAEYFKVCH